MSKKLIVGKYGSSCVADRYHGVKQESIDRYAREWARVQAAGLGVILVTSGAQYTGEAIWRRCYGKDFEHSSQPFAMIGNPVVMNAWRLGFEKRGLISAELLVTKHELDDTQFPDSEGNIVHGVLKNNLAHGIVTVANYNDSLDPREIEKVEEWGDNDFHSLTVARFMGADALYLATEAEGLRTGSGIIRHVGANEADWARAQGWAGPSEEGRPGGMSSKVNIAISAAKLGMEAFIAPANASVLAVLERRVPATYFEPVTAA